MGKFAYVVWALCVTLVVTLFNYVDSSGSYRSWGSGSGSRGSVWHK